MDGFTVFVETGSKTIGREDFPSSLRCHQYWRYYFICEMIPQGPIVFGGLEMMEGQEMVEVRDGTRSPRMYEG